MSNSPSKIELNMQRKDSSVGALERTLGLATSLHDALGVAASVFLAAVDFFGAAGGGTALDCFVVRFALLDIVQVQLTP